jgi:hypothetical protein
MAVGGGADRERLDRPPWDGVDVGALARTRWRWARFRHVALQ